MFVYWLNFAYLVALVAASPWLVYQSFKTGKYRDGFRAKLWGLAPRREGDQPCIWFHAVSVGEVNLVRSLVDEFRRRHAEWTIVISTTTQSGFAVARQRYPECSVFYCPLDFSWAVRRAMRRVRPAILALVELELWPNLIRAAHEQGARVAVVNGRLSDQSVRGYARWRWFIRGAMRQIDLIAAQNEESAGRFIALGAVKKRVHCAGSLKFDGAQTDRHNSATAALRRTAGVAMQDVVFLAGSTQAPEESILLAAYRQLLAEFPRLKLVVVPRHPERFDEVARLLDKAEFQWSRRSAWSEAEIASEEPLDALVAGRRDWQVLLVDRVGELGAWWGLADVGFVGGSLGSRGGQNMIEPAAYGVAVCFGPDTRNFRDIVRTLLAADAARVIHDAREIAAFVRGCLHDRNLLAALGNRARQVVMENQGATLRTVELLNTLIVTTPGSCTAGRSSTESRSQAA